MSKQNPATPPAESVELAAIRAYLKQHRATYHEHALHAKLLEDGHDPQLVAAAMAEAFPHTEIAAEARITTFAYAAFFAALLLFFVLNLINALPLVPEFRLYGSGPGPRPTVAECQAGSSRESCPYVLERYRQRLVSTGWIVAELIGVLILAFGLRGRWRPVGRGAAAGIALSMALVFVLWGMCVSFVT